MKKKTFQKILFVLGCFVAAVAVFCAGYVIYMQSHYYRIADNTKLEVENPVAEELAGDGVYSILTYNIGFGAYNHDFSFFMDTGVMNDGTAVQGKYSRAQSRDIVTANITGAVSALKKYSADFMILQEVDTKATRSFYMNEKDMISQAFPGYSSVFASNFHSTYLIYPFTEPHGSVNAGLLTFSRYEIAEAVRRSYPVDNSFFTKYTDLDRCFACCRFPVSGGKELVIINSHMSAYDKGGKIRAQQLALLTSVMEEEYKKGNYVITGGDFNHALCGSETMYASGQQIPGWIAVFSDSELPQGFSIVRADNIETVPTNRSTDLPYTKGVNYTVTIDGFIVSDNLTAAAQNIDTDFTWSDHNPVLMTFSFR